MKNAVFIFHGTEGYPEENWFPWLKNELEKHDCHVIVPQFPSPPVIPAKISEWFDVIASYERFFDSNTVIIGHSLGGKFALRVLEKVGQPVKAAIFVGTPIGVPPIANNERDSAFTGNDFDWNVIREKAKNFAVFQSDNDPYVGLNNGKELARNLKVHLSFIPNAGHFNTKSGYTEFETLKQKVLGFLNDPDTNRSN